MLSRFLEEDQREARVSEERERVKIGYGPGKLAHNHTSPGYSWRKLDSWIPGCRKSGKTRKDAKRPLLTIFATLRNNRMHSR